MAAGDVTATGCAMLDSGLGLRLVAVHPDAKRPIPSLMPRGVVDATDDPRIWHQWLALWPNAGMGVVPGDRLAVVDDDRGDLDTDALGINGTWAESTRRGWHRWVSLPTGTYRRTKLPDGAGDVIAGDRAYVVASPTPPYRPLDLAAPILPVPPDSALWRVIRAERPALGITLPDVTPADRREAQRVISALADAPFPIGRDARALLAGIVPPDASPSEADYRLALLASYWSRDPAVIAAVLDASKLGRAKWERPDYVPRLIADALRRREELSVSAPPQPTTVRSETRHVAEDIPTAILDEIALSIPGIDWPRLDVGTLAKACGVNRKTITRHIDRLERRGLIETRLIDNAAPGHPYTWRLARLVAREEAE